MMFYKFRGQGFIIHNQDSHPSTRYLWFLKSKDHIHDREMNKINGHLGIISFKDFIQITSVKSFSKDHSLSILAQS